MTQQLFTSTFPKRRPSLFIIYLILVTFPQGQILGQSHQLATLNNGGNSIKGSTMNLEWSLAESVVVGVFTIGSSQFSFGVLQPMGQVVTGLLELGGTVFGNTIQVVPNPTTGPIDIVSNLSQAGKITFQVLNGRSESQFNQAYDVFPTKQIKAISLNQYPPGIYYLHLLFEPKKGLSKTSIYKIIKL